MNFLIVFLALLIVGCGSSENRAQTTISETEAAKLTETYIMVPTDTSAPTFTLSPSETPTTTPSEPTLTPEPIIVWSDDFEDGDTDGWEDGTPIKGDEYLVSEGVLSFGRVGGDTQHPSPVSIGSWSFDVYIPETQGLTSEIRFIVSNLCCVSSFNFIMVSIENNPDTGISLESYGGSELTDATVIIEEGKKLTGWHHIDITRGEDEYIKIYFDGVLQIDTFLNFPFQSEYFYFMNWNEGFGIDNIVVHNYVIDIQSPSK